MSQLDSTALQWRKSSRCDANACVEVALHHNGIAVRDNTRPEVQLAFDDSSWRRLLVDLRSDVVGS